MSIPKLVLSLWLCAILASGAALTTGPTENKFERGQKQTVTVETKYGWGSGFFVKRTGYDGKVKWFVWTAAHVANKAGAGNRMNIQVSIRDKDNRLASVSVGGTVIIRADKEDLALLVLDESKEAWRFEASDFSSTDTRVGDDIFIIGTSSGDTDAQFVGTVTRGNVSQKSINPKLLGWAWQDLDQTSTVSYHGNSGGPVFNSNGEVVGMLVAGVDATLNGYVPVRTFEKWAEKSGLGWAIRGERCPVVLPKLKDLPPTPQPLKIIIPLFP